MHSTLKSSEKIKEILLTSSSIPLPLTLVYSLGLYQAVLYSWLVDKSVYYLKQNRALNGWFYASKKTIHEETGLPASAIQKAIDELKVRGLIFTKQQGIYRATWYMVNPEPPHLDDMCTNHSLKHTMKTEQPSGGWSIL